MNHYIVQDTKRQSFYTVDAFSSADAIQAAQNDQWAEQLDPANVTPVAAFKAFTLVRLKPFTGAERLDRDKEVST